MSREWFYRFRLPDGRVSPCYVGDELVGFHQNRVSMLDSVVDPLFPGAWEKVTCLDLACHEGFFACHMARKGCGDVLGVDVRAQHVEHANLIRQAYQLDNLRFEQQDVLALHTGELGMFDVVIVFGLIYHLEDPIGALRRAHAHTRRVCVVETQVAPNLSGLIDWGSHRAIKPIVGSFALVDEREEVARGNAEASVLRLSLVPSVDALIFVLRALGFSRVEVVTPPPDSYEQLQFGKRVVVAAYLD
jgi:tRNA (mo5U34)-methyltransferase